MAVCPAGRASKDFRKAGLPDGAELVDERLAFIEGPVARRAAKLVKKDWPMIEGRARAILASGDISTSDESVRA